MATGRSMQLTKQVGEYLVSAELCRRGLVSTTFSGNVPWFDILATNEKLETIPIQVKTISKGDWQFNAKVFLEISISNKIQTIEGVKKLPYPDLVCVLVRLKGQNQDEFYICRMRDLQNIIHSNYKEWVEKTGGRRRQNSKSTHCLVHVKQVNEFKHKWDKVTK